MDGRKSRKVGKRKHLVLRHYRNEVSVSLSQADWVALRLLFLLLAVDPSNVNIKDVRRTLSFYEPEVLIAAFNELNWEHRKTGMFDGQPDSAMLRALAGTVQ